MTAEHYIKVADEFAEALLGFVKIASSEKATAEEVEALPAVAGVLVNLLALTQKTD